MDEVRIHFGLLISSDVRAGSPSRSGDGGCCTTALARSCFYSVFVSVFMALSTVFHSINPPDNSPLSRCSAGVISALLVLSTISLFMKVSLSPDIILRG